MSLIFISYRRDDLLAGERDNPAMVDVAKNLDDEQMKALAVYFASLKDKSTDSSRD